MSFPQRVRKFRREKRLSQSALAELAGVSPRTIYGYEAGTTFPRTEKMLNRLAEALDVTREALVDDSIVPELTLSLQDDQPISTQAHILTRQVTSLLQGDYLIDEEKDIMVQTIMDAYWESKRKNRE